MTVVLLISSLCIPAFLTGAFAEPTRAQVNYVISINGTNVVPDPVSGEKKDTIAPSSPSPYSVMIQNLAPYQETFDLQIKNIPANWSALFTDSQLITTVVSDVQASSQAVVNIIIASSQYSVANITVEAKSRAGLEVKSDHILITCQQDTLTITADASTRYVGAGQGATYKVSVKNNDNSTLTANLGLSGGLKSATTAQWNEWAFHFDLPSLQIGPLGTGKCNLTLFAPKNATPNQNKVVKMEGTVTGNSRVFFSGELNTIVKEIYDLSITVTPDQIQTVAGNYLNYTIRVENRANNSDEVRIDIIDNPESWPYQFTGAFDNLMEKFKISAHQVKLVYLNVTVLLSAKAGKHVLTLNLTSKGGSTKHQVTTYINESHALEMGLTGDTTVIGQNPFYPITLAPTALRLVLKSRSNTKETTTLTIKDPPDGWQIAFAAVDTSKETKNTTQVDASKEVDVSKAGVKYSFASEVDKMTLKMEAFQEIYPVFMVRTPANAPAGTTTFQIATEYGTITDPLSILFTVRLSLTTANIEILDLDRDGFPDINLLNPNATAGESNKLSVTIKNNYTLATTDITVQLLIDEKVVDSENIPQMEAGEVKEVVLEWKDPTSGSHLVQVKVTGPKVTNTPSANTRIEVSGEGGSNTMFFVILAIIIVLIIAVIVGAFVYMRFFKPDAKSEEGAKQEEYERVYGRKGKADKKQKASLDKETEDYFYSDKYKSRKSQDKIKDDYEKLYGDKMRQKRNAQLPPSSRRQEQLEDGDRRALPPARRDRPSRQERPSKPSRDRPDRTKSSGRPSRDGKKGRRGEE